MAVACGQLPEFMQLKVLSEGCRLAEPGAYTCELSALRMAAEHEPADVSVHENAYWMTVGVAPGAQLTGSPVVCSTRAATAVAARLQLIDDAGWPIMAASAVVMLVVTGAEQPAPAGCVRKWAKRRACGGRHAGRRDSPRALCCAAPRRAARTMFIGIETVVTAVAPTRGVLAVRPRPTPRPTAAATKSATKMTDTINRRLHGALAGASCPDKSGGALAVEASDMAL